MYSPPMVLTQSSQVVRLAAHNGAIAGSIPASATKSSPGDNTTLPWPTGLELQMAESGSGSRTQMRSCGLNQRSPQIDPDGLSGWWKPSTKFARFGV